MAETVKEMIERESRINILQNHGQYAVIKNNTKYEIVLFFKDNEYIAFDTLDSYESEQDAVSTFNYLKAYMSRNEFDLNDG